MPKKTAGELRAEVRLLRLARATNSSVRVLTELIKWVGLVGIARYGYLSIAVLAGQNTFAHIGLKVLGEIGISDALSWILTVLGVGYGLRQRMLRRDTVEHLHGRIRTLENQRDPRRTSSQLTARGDTNPKDNNV